MDITQIKRGTVALDILHPETGDKLGLTLILRSPNDPEVRKVAEQSIERQRAAARRRKPFTVQQENREGVKINAACVVDLKWDGEASLGGERPDYSPEVAENLLSYDFILQQVAEQLQEDRDFFNASAKP